MQAEQIAGLLKPFVGTSLPLGKLQSISIYIDILLRWNRKISLTAIRDPEEIVIRHFGESLFAAQQLFGAAPQDRTSVEVSEGSKASQPTAPGLPTKPAEPWVIDVGSGAGFPGLPIKIWAPGIHLVLIESNQKKATFLREAGRALGLAGVDVFSGRAEHFSEAADVVTLRAVERFQSILPVAARLVRSGGRIALLIGEKQYASAGTILPNVDWGAPQPVPLSEARVVVIGRSRASR